MKYLKTEAIVLKKINLPNQDSLVSLFTEETGKVVCRAYGIKKITSRRLPHNQTANLILAVLVKKKDYYYLQETSLISIFSQIKKDRHKLNSLYTFFYILDKLLPEREKETEIYRLVKKFLIQLSRSNHFKDSQLSEYLNLVLFRLGYTKENHSLSELTMIIEEIINQKIPFFSI